MEKTILDIVLTSISKLAFGREKQALVAPAPAPVVSSSVVYGNDDLLTILMAVALIAVTFALILSLSRR
jgi:hypothetical protein